MSVYLSHCCIFTYNAGFPDMPTFARRPRHRRTEFLQWPRVLLGHFKRWQYNAFTKTFQKVGSAIDLPATYGPIANVSYNLRSIVEHIGPAREGHYVACARDGCHGWLHYNDSDTPVRVDEQAVLKRRAYLLCTNALLKLVDEIQLVQSCGAGW